MSAEDRWLTIPEAARSLGVTPQAIRKRLKRGTINSRIGNRGQALVQVANPQEPEQEPTQPLDRNWVANPSVSWDEHHRLLGVQQARHDAETARQLAERDRLHQEHLDRFHAQTAIERALMLERIDAAELRAERVEQRLDQVLDHLMQQQSAGERPASWLRWRWWR